MTTKKTTTAKNSQVVKLPRGIRNNNPLNIVYNSHNRWHGKLPYNKIIESRFCRFSEMMWGFRAAACLLRKYINSYGLNTISEIIERWAPSNENNTDAYIKFVETVSGYSRNTKIRFKDMVVMLRIMSAMCAYENGMEFDPQKNNDLWQALYRGYIMARENTKDFISIDENI